MYRTLLTIGDSQALMEKTKKILERSGYSVRSAVDIAEARKQLMDYIPDGVILENELSDGNGIEFCRELRETSDVPVMFLSGCKDDELTALQVGADDFLKKPFDYDVLKARLKIMLNVKTYLSVPKSEDVSNIVILDPKEEITISQHEEIVTSQENEIVTSQENEIKTSQQNKITTDHQEKIRTDHQEEIKLNYLEEIKVYQHINKQVAEFSQEKADAEKKQVKRRSFVADIAVVCLLLLGIAIFSYLNSAPKDNAVSDPLDPRHSSGDVVVAPNQRTYPDQQAYSLQQAYPGDMSDQTVHFLKTPDQETLLSDAPLLPDESATLFTGDTVIVTEGAGYLAPSYDNVTLPADAEEVELTLVNPEGNQCYFVFELVLESTGEMLYKSGLVEPGMCIESFTPSRTIGKGNYKAALSIHAYEMRSLDAIDSEKVEFDLVVV